MATKKKTAKRKKKTTKRKTAKRKTKKKVAKRNPRKKTTKHKRKRKNPLSDQDLIVKCKKMVKNLENTVDEIEDLMRQLDDYADHAPLRDDMIINDASLASRSLGDLRFDIVKPKRILRSLIGDLEGRKNQDRIFTF